jgi:hypothetical protein
MAALSRFDELRIKTDKQLLQIVKNAIDLGICEARQALRSADTWTVAEEYYLRAKRGCAEASLLMPLAGEIPEEERVRWEENLGHLREMLEGLSVLGSTSAPAGESIPALARALWKSRGCPEGSPEHDWFQAERALQSQPACVGN